MDQRLKIMDQGSWIMDHGSKIMDHGSRILDLGPCFGMNGHFRRDPDVISKLSESTIEDLSVFIGLGSLSSVKIIVLNENIGFV